MIGVRKDAWDLRRDVVCSCDSFARICAAVRDFEGLEEPSLSFEDEEEDFSLDEEGLDMLKINVTK